jgi:hypothetical protein
MRDHIESDRPHLLLINPWITDFAAYDFWLKPMGLLYLAGVLRDAGYSVRLVDCMDRAHPELLKWQGIKQPVNRRWSTGKFLRAPIPKPSLYCNVPRLYARYGMPPEIFERLCLAGPKPDAILVTSGMTYWYPGVQTTSATLRRVFGDTPILLGGIYATLCTDHARKSSGADLVISGEAEPVIEKIVQTIIGGTKRNIPGEGDSVNKTEAIQSRLSTLDNLPFPAFDLYPQLPDQQFHSPQPSARCAL